MIKIFIVTYRNPPDLNANIKSLLDSDILDYDHSITVINNHRDFQCDYLDTISVLHNVTRPLNSTGHLSRNWNQAIIHGFGSLSSPQCDILVHVQDDVIFATEWATCIKRLHSSYSFISAGIGDAFCSYTIGAVKKIGLWDERFCNIGYQEADYFLRAVIYNGDKSSINDPGHGRTHNPVAESYHAVEADNRGEGETSGIVKVPRQNAERRTHYLRSGSFNTISEKIFIHKWGDYPSANWNNTCLPTKTLCHNYVYYPYFEKEIENLEEKNYIL